MRSKSPSFSTSELCISRMIKYKETASVAKSDINIVKYLTNFWKIFIPNDHTLTIHTKKKVSYQSQWRNDKINRKKIPHKHINSIMCRRVASSSLLCNAHNLCTNVILENRNYQIRPSKTNKFTTKYIKKLAEIRDRQRKKKTWIIKHRSRSSGSPTNFRFQKKNSNNKFIPQQKLISFFRGNKIVMEKRREKENDFFSSDG